MRCVLFDLDETLTDHKYACTKGIEAIMEVYPELHMKSSEQLESEFWEMLNGNYNHVLAGSLRMEDARLERISSLFRGCDLNPPENLEELATTYIQVYKQSLRAIPGIIEVLSKLRQLRVQIAVLTNGFTKVQHRKLDDCNLLEFIDTIITSEDAGFPKPDPRIFELALDKCGVTKDEVIMIGDSLTNDIEGANCYGIRTIWLNRRNEARPEHILSIEISKPLEILEYIF